jgi:putative oxidoreductase
MNNLFTKKLILAGNNSIATTLLRITFGLLMLTHGYDKIIHFSEKALNFFDLFGLGGEITLGLVIFSEVFCSILLCIGLFTRIVLIPLIFTMSIAFFVVHNDSSFREKEVALLYLLVYIIIFVSGQSKMSFDYLFFRRKKWK